MTEPSDVKDLEGLGMEAVTKFERTARSRFIGKAPKNQVGNL